MPLKIRPVEKLFFTIGEVAEDIGATPSMLRFWEKEFGTPRPRRDNKGDRLYTKDDIKVVRSIHHLIKERGFTIQGAKEHLKNNSDDVDRISEARDRLRVVRDQLAALRDAMEGTATH